MLEYLEASCIGIVFNVLSGVGAFQVMLQVSSSLLSEAILTQPSLPRFLVPCFGSTAARIICVVPQVQKIQRPYPVPEIIDVPVDVSAALEDASMWESERNIVPYR